MFRMLHSPVNNYQELKIVHKKRHRWTAEQDARLVQMVDEKGPAWSAIAGELGIQGSALKVRRRWEVLQPKHGSAWSKAEDTDLANIIGQHTELGYALGDMGLWVKVSQQLKTNRSPRQSHARWTKTLLPRQGKALPFTRFERIRGWVWSDEEVGRLRAAVAVVSESSDSQNAIDCAQEFEPWLLIGINTAETLKPQYWTSIASQVGTRTAAQCVSKWNNLLGQLKGTSITTDQAKRLAALVKTHGRKWGFLAHNYFPDQSPVDLCYAYSLWRRVEKKYGVDLLNIDPFSMIRDFDGRSAMRPTGADGNYDPNGSVVRVFKSGSSSFMTPYTLALANTSFRKRKSGMLRVIGLVHNPHGGLLPVKAIDKLVAALSRHSNDWVSISREVGLPITVCRRYAEGLASSLNSVKDIISNLELDDLASKSGLKTIQRPKKALASRQGKMTL
ncbi:hypothetical protein LPJ66_006272 [Kickxella alabastrina]|uniref:Uncharacterized protein n=1 Tax=Kickxella alabastrina TaxID=61397 RepID=A0ACC1ICD7_9FUNG|nr:hypothetical protein LPJ66_006272 [Kickxella alabastrina]